MIIISLLIVLIFISLIFVFKKTNRIKKQYSLLDIAKYIVFKYEVNNIQLQKILLYLQIQFYNKYEYPLFKESFILQGKYFILESIYLYFCGFGSMTITYKFPFNIPLDNDLCIFINDELDNTLYREIDIVYSQLYTINKTIITFNDIINFYIKKKGH